MTPDPAAAALTRTVAADRGRMIAAVIAAVGDWQAAEDALQDAAERALQVWRSDGVPSNPAGWLVATARRRAIDLLRRAQTRDHTVQRLGLEAERGFLDSEPAGSADEIPDDRLRLIFTCCHPALELDTRVALTLRTVLGWTPADIGRVLLTSETAMTKRLVRARAKIAHANIPYRVPDRADLPRRLSAVLTVIYLVFTRGYTSRGEDDPRDRDLPGEAIRLCRVLRQLLPSDDHGQIETAGLLALMIAHHARDAARTDSSSTPVLLPDQDRSLWDHEGLAEASSILERVLIRAAHERIPVGPYVLQASIAIEHARPGRTEPDWSRIVQLHGLLLRVAPTPAVRLAHAVSVGHALGANAGLDTLDRIPSTERSNHLWHAARADLLRRSGRNGEALDELHAAMHLATAPADITALQAVADRHRDARDR